MPGRIEKTIFISYRRTNLPWALAIFQNLKSEGYDVFFDYLSIPSGDFEKIIIENIKARAHFIVILTPSALERCNEPGDWLRREIEAAMDEKRNIVPLMLESFDFGSPSTTNALTGKLEKLKKYNALRLHSEYFFEGMDRLRKQYLNVSLDMVFHPVSENVTSITEKHQAAANQAAQVRKEQLTAQEWFERGYFFNENKKYDEAIRCYTEALLLAPKLADAYNNRGLAYCGKGDLINALKDLNKAIDITPEDSDYYGNIAFTIIENNGDLDQALEAINSAIKINPNSAIYYNNRGRIYYRKQQFEKAISDFSTAIKQNSTYVHPYVNRAHVHRIKDEIDEAIADYSKAISLKISDDSVFYFRGILFSKKNNFNEALKDLSEAIQKSPNDITFRIAQIDVLKKMNKQSEAKVQEQIAREFLHKESQYNKACFEAVCGEIDKSFEYLKESLETREVTKDWVKQDSDLANIRNDPRFKVLVGD